MTTLKLKSELKIPRSVEQKLRNTSTYNLGVGMIVSFYIIIFYSFYTSIKKKKNIGFSVIHGSKKSFTLSQTLINSEKYVIIFFSLLYMFLGFYISYRKNLLKWDFSRLLIVFSFFCTSFSYISMLYIGPDKPLHYIIAIILFLNSVVTVYFIHKEYNKYFEDNDSGIINTFHNMMIVCIIFGSMLMLTFIYKFILLSYFRPKYTSRRFKIFDWFLTDIMAISEYIVILLFGVLLYIFAIFPPLPPI